MRNGGNACSQKVCDVAHTQFFHRESGDYAEAGGVAENFEDFRKFFERWRVGHAAAHGVHELFVHELDFTDVVLSLDRCSAWHLFIPSFEQTIK